MNRLLGDIKIPKSYATSTLDSFVICLEWLRCSETSSRLSEIVESCVPSKLSERKHNLPWITVDVKRKMRKRDKLLTKAHISNNQIDWKSFRSYRNYVTKLVRSSHRDYVNNVIGNNLTENPKSFWSYVKLMRTENLGIPTLKSDNKMCSSDFDKAEALNLQFKNVFNKPTTNASQVQSKGKSPYESISYLHIGVERVAKQLSKLNPSKAAGPDEMSPCLLKIVAHE